MYIYIYYILYIHTQACVYVCSMCMCKCIQHVYDMYAYVYVSLPPLWMWCGGWVGWVGEGVTPHTRGGREHKTRVFMCIYIYIHNIYIYIRIYIYTHTYIHTYMYTYSHHITVYQFPHEDQHLLATYPRPSELEPFSHEKTGAPVGTATAVASGVEARHHRAAWCYPAGKNGMENPSINGWWLGVALF